MIRTYPFRTYSRSVISLIFLLIFFRENDIAGVIDTTFSVECCSFGALITHELKPNGSQITVTDQNKKDYVRLYVNYRFMRGIEQQFLALQKGFSELIPIGLLHAFDERELELVIGGISSIDVADWKQHTRLKHCVPETPVVQWFWQVNFTNPLIFLPSRKYFAIFLNF